MLFIAIPRQPIGAEFFSALGIEKVWDGGIVTAIPDDLEGIDPVMFWAGGKLFALRSFKAPCVMIDTDFIIWENPDFSDKIIAAHEEYLNPDIYPPPTVFKVSPDALGAGLDYSTLPLNTAFLYIPDEDFKQYYTSQAIAFMKSAEHCGDYLTYMVYAEQRLLPMLAKRCGIKYGTLLDKDRLFFPQKKYTHLWGAKQKLRDDKEQYEKFCRKCADRIYTSFPDYKFVIKKLEAFKNGK